MIFTAPNFQRNIKHQRLQRIFVSADVSLSKKSPERVAFLCMIWYNKKGDENAAKGKKGKKSA